MDKLRLLFIGLSVGLTVISLWAGIGAYAALFGWGMAVLISAIFEILRLSTLYSISLFDGFYRRLILVLYAMVAVVCFSAGIVSFSAKVIESQDLRQIEIKAGMSEDAYKLKHAFSLKIDERIKQLEKDKDKIRTQLASNPESKIWGGRLTENEKRINEANEERDKFLFDAAAAKESVSWIATWKAKLGVEDVKDSYKELASPTSRAATEIFGVNDLQLQKWAGIVITLAVEIGIILLAILGINIKKEEDSDITDEDWADVEGNFRGVENEFEQVVEKKPRPRKIIGKKGVKNA